MSEAEPDESEVFDVDKVRQLVELMKAHDLSEIDLRQADQRIRLRRGDKNLAPTVVAAPAIAAHAAPPPPVAIDPGTVAAPVEPTEEDDKNIVYIRSPMVGTFYSKPNPNTEPYIKIGDRVSPETKVCIIEAMKMFNEIEAECSGLVVAVLVENEEPVDVNKALFKVDKSK